MEEPGARGWRLPACPQPSSPRTQTCGACAGGTEGHVGQGRGAVLVAAAALVVGIALVDTAFVT